MKNEFDKNKEIYVFLVNLFYLFSVKVLPW